MEMKKIHCNKWQSFAISSFLMALAGATYDFALYSPLLKGLGYTQIQINIIAVCKDLGGNVFGFFSGPTYNRKSPSFCLVLAGISNAVGYVVVWLAVEKMGDDKHILRLIIICLGILVGTASQTFTCTVAHATTVRNFPTKRGFIVGAMTGFIGLSGALFQLLYWPFHSEGAAASFILLIAFLPAAANLSVLVFDFEEDKTEVRGENQDVRILWGYFWVSLLAVIVIIVAILRLVLVIFRLGQPFILRCIFATVILLIVLLFCLHFGCCFGNNKVGDLEDPKAIEAQSNETDSDLEDLKAREAQREDLKAREAQSNETDSDLEDPKAREAQSNETDSNLEDPKAREAQSNETDSSRTLSQVAKNWNLWILFLSLVCTGGAASVATNNTSQLCAALGYSNTVTDVIIKETMVGNSFGRMLSGVISNMPLGRQRPYVSAAFSSFAIVGYLLVASTAFMGSWSVHVGFIAIGMLIGANWTLACTMVCELFGQENYPVLCNIVGLASFCGNLLLSLPVAGRLYDLEARRQHSHQMLVAGPASGYAPSPSSSELLCHGIQCYQSTFFIMAAVSFVGLVLNCVLSYHFVVEHTPELEINDRVDC